MLKSILATALVAALVLAPASAQPAPTTRTDLQRHDLSIPGREAVQVRVDVAPGAAVGPHTHPGEEIIYVLRGTLEYTVAGRGAVTLHAGDVLFIPYRTVHSVRNIGADTASELATYVVEKGQPLLTPVQ